MIDWEMYSIFGAYRHVKWIRSFLSPLMSTEKLYWLLQHLPKEIVIEVRTRVFMIFMIFMIFLIFLILFDESFNSVNFFVFFFSIPQRYILQDCLVPIANVPRVIEHLSGVSPSLEGPLWLLPIRVINGGSYGMPTPLHPIQNRFPCFGVPSLKSGFDVDYFFAEKRS